MEYHFYENEQGMIHVVKSNARICDGGIPEGKQLSIDKLDLIPSIMLEDIISEEYEKTYEEHKKEFLSKTLLEYFCPLTKKAGVKKASLYIELENEKMCGKCMQEICGDNWKCLA